MRNVAKAGDLGNFGCEILAMNVDSDESVQQAFSEIYDAAGRVDVLINNAGYALRGAIELVRIEALQRNMQTNVYGVIRCMQQVLPKMREQGSGTIVNVSSGVGRYVFPFSGPYSATKFALEAISEAAEYELRPFGVRVVVVEPGFIRNNFQANSEQTPSEGTEYAPLQQMMRERLANAAQNGSDSLLVAEVILSAIEDPEPRFRYTAGPDVTARVARMREITDDEFRAETRRALGFESWHPETK
jgi:NAD(P)-dependent dehydrogenase (short-subunit alcohol dehydrogenase family)